MSIGESYVAALGTVVVTALAIGAAVGTHALVGDTTVDAGATPGVTTSISPADDFCGLMGQLMALGIDGKAPFDDTTSTVSTGGTDDAAALEALHADGQKLIDSSAKVSALETRAATVVADPAIATAFGDSAKLFDYAGSVFGPMERDATSTGAFFSAAMGAAFDPKAAAITTAGDTANATITAYVQTTCGIDLGGTPTSASPTPSLTSGTFTFGGDESDPATAAQTDATAIGEKLTAMFAEWSTGDPLPTVDFSGGMFTVDSGSGSMSVFSASSSNSAIADEFINGPTDWCVSVEVTGSPSATYNYSAAFGLTEGTCS
jgi:hypothetical protein